MDDRNTTLSSRSGALVGIQGLCGETNSASGKPSSFTSIAAPPDAVRLPTAALVVMAGLDSTRAPGIIEARPDVTVRIVDDASAAVDAAWIEASACAPASRTPGQKARLALSDVLVAELCRATEVVIFIDTDRYQTAQAASRWLDLVSRLDVTFRLASGKAVGLLKGRRATIHVSGSRRASPRLALALLDLRDGLAILGFDPIEMTGARWCAPSHTCVCSG